jgi:hypothetical protein
MDDKHRKEPFFDFDCIEQVRQRTQVQQQEVVVSQTHSVLTRRNEDCSQSWAITISLDKGM